MRALPCRCLRGAGAWWLPMTPGTLLFTGYLATAPVALYAGAASAGAVFRYVLEATGDEWLLDKQTGGLRTGAALGATGGALLQALTARVDAKPLCDHEPGGGTACGRAAGYRGRRVEPARGHDCECGVQRLSCAGRRFDPGHAAGRGAWVERCRRHVIA